MTNEIIEKGITLIRVVREFEWDDASQQCRVEQTTHLTEHFEAFFKDVEYDLVKKGILTDVVNYISLDMDALSDAYKCVYFDCDDEKCFSGKFFDGLTLSIEYVLHDNEVLFANVDTRKMLKHASDIGLVSEKVDDRIKFLSRFVESSAQDSCDYLLDIVTDLISSESSINNFLARMPFGVNQ